MNSPPPVRASVVAGACWLAVIGSACIGAPPSSPARDTGIDRDLAHDAAPLLDAKPFHDSASTDTRAPDILDSGFRDQGAEAAIDTGADLSIAEMGVVPQFLPMRRLRAAWIADQTLSLETDTVLAAAHLRIGMNVATEFTAPSAASGHDLILLSGESDDHYGADEITAVAPLATPVIAYVSTVLNELNMSAGSGSEPDPQTFLTVTNPPHPIASFLGPGPHAIYATPARMQHRDTIGEDAEVVGLNELGHPTIFTFGLNARMLPIDLANHHRAPARRVAFNPNAFSHFDIAGWDLVHNAVLWALSEPDNATMRCHLVANQPYGSTAAIMRSRMRMHGCAVDMVSADAVSIPSSDLVVVMPDVSASTSSGVDLAAVDAPILMFWNQVDALQAMGLANPVALVTNVLGDEWALLPSADHRLRAGRAGNVVVATSDQATPTLTIAAGIPLTAVPVAGLPNASGAVSVWAVEDGAMLPSVGGAPARRVAFASPTSSVVPTFEALDLVDGAIQWLIGP